MRKLTNLSDLSVSDVSDGVKDGEAMIRQGLRGTWGDTDHL